MPSLARATCPGTHTNTRCDPCACRPGSSAWVGKVACSPCPAGHSAELSPPGHQPGREHWKKLQGRNPEAQLPPGEPEGVLLRAGFGLLQELGWHLAQASKADLVSSVLWLQSSQVPGRVALSSAVNWDEDGGFLLEGGKLCLTHSG